jgi:hypothetical protein
MSLEVFSEFTVPDNPTVDLVHGDMLTVVGNLRGLEFAVEPVFIWVMTEYGVEASWTKYFKLDVPFLFHTLTPIFSIRTHQGLVILLDVTLMVYRYIIQRFDFVDVDVPSRFEYVCPYVESLVSPRSYEGS